MRNKVIILSLSLILVLCSSFSVFASTHYSFPMVEPSTSDTQGYLVVTNPSFSDRVVFYWSIQPYSYSSADKSGSLPSMNIILNDDSIQFTALCTGDARVTLTRVYNESSQNICMSRAFSTSTSFTYTGMSNVEYYVYNGNIGIIDDNLSSGSNFLNVTWGNDEDFQDDFNELTTLIQDTYDRVYEMRFLVEDITGFSQSMVSDLDNMLTLLNTLVGQVDDVKAILSRINVNLLNCYSELRSINSELDGIHSDMNERLDDVNNELDDIHSTLKKAINQLGKEDTSSLDDSSIGSLGGDEDAVLSDDSSKLDDLSFSFGNAFDVVWDLISRAWQSNSKVFTVVIMCLTVGLIKLILNR